MQKTIHTPRQKALLRLMRETRKKAGLTQVDLAERLTTSQSFISKCERGERRLDVLELHQFCKAMNVPFLDFCKRLDQIL